MVSLENIFCIGEVVAARAVTKLGEQHIGTVYLEAGSTSSVFKVSTNKSNYILRIASPRGGKFTSYESDYSIRNTIWTPDLPIAKPIATDQSFDIGMEAIWAIDEFREGHHPSRGAIAPLVSRQLGALLQKLHKISVTGFGQLENTRCRLHGKSESPINGLLTRFETPWPFSTVSLRNHPSVRAQPKLEEKLLPLETELREFSENGTPTIVHSDLHERQLLEYNGNLTTVLDFNDAVVGRPEWDLGSYLYFHGEGCLSDLLDGYTLKGQNKLILKKRAKLAAIIIALHHGNRGEILGKSHRIEASVRFLQNWLF
ncbi:MAG: aminoglycoside phosphotransferase family protein [Acidiferrobacterales bacterium]|nr:aminoglycoside phosphotransferase family protein [Acidiferrobacterales bacterium]